MKRWFGLIVLILLAACQTMPQQTAFADRQVAALEAAGFSKVGDNYELGLEDRLLFDVDRSEVRPEMVDRLGAMVRSLISVGIRGARLEGHADSTGSADHNERLSQERANAVRGILVAQGFESTRIEAIGLGEAEPLASNRTDEGRSQNRRVVIIIRPSDLLAM